MNKLDSGKFAFFLGECADRRDGYIMCATGQDPKALNEWYFSGQYSGEKLEKANEWRETAERVWDCQGLADGYVSEMTGKKVNIRARQNYADWCGVRGDGIIPAKRRVPGAAVFHRGTYIDHVGFLEKPVDAENPSGDWIVIEARGVMHGVVRTRLSGRNWNCWGWMTRYFSYPEAEEQQAEYGERSLRRGMTGADVAALQRDLISLNYSCGKWGADGEFGKATESALMAFQQDYGLSADGIAGAKTFAKLDQLLVEDDDMPRTEEPVKSILIGAGQSWNIRVQPDSGAAVMGYARRGERYAPSGQEADGWVGVLFHDEPAWVSAKAVAA